MAFLVATTKQAWVVGLPRELALYPLITSNSSLRFRFGSFMITPVRNTYLLEKPQFALNLVRFRSPALESSQSKKLKSA